MSDIVNIDDYRPHMVQEVKCNHCGYEWVAVFPEDTEKLECPKCAKKVNGHAIDIGSQTYTSEGLTFEGFGEGDYEPF